MGHSSVHPECHGEGAAEDGRIITAVLVAGFERPGDVRQYLAVVRMVVMTALTAVCDYA